MSAPARRMSRRGWALLVFGFAAPLAGCTFMPRGAALLQREAVRAGRPFAAGSHAGHLPKLPDVPTSEELVRRALLNSPDVQSAYWQWRAAIEAITLRGTETTVPALAATVGLKNGAASDAGTLLQLANMSSAPIEWPAKPLAEARAALQRAYAAGWEFRRAQFTVRRQTLDAWYRLVSDTAKLNLLRRDAALVGELDEFAQAGIEAGTVGPGAALRIENELTGLHARMRALQGRLPADRAAVNRVLGRPATRPLGVPQSFPRLSAARGSITRLVELAVRGNPDLAALRREIRAGRIDIERASMNYVPDFSLSAATGLDGLTQSLGGALMFPFVRYRAIDAAIRQNRDWLRERRAQLRSRRLGISAQLVSDLEMVHSDGAQIALYSRDVLPRLGQLAAFARMDVAQTRASIDALVQIERTRVQIQETLLELRLDEARRLADLDALTAARLAGAD